MSNDDNLSEQDTWTFRGFTSPNYTQVPDEFFDFLAPRLKEGELRVALYIIRRTFGFKKGSDDISLRQMVEGIRTKDGRALDYGTGLSKPAVVKAVRALVDLRVILATSNHSRERGFEPTTYRLNVQQTANGTPPLLTSFTSPSKRKQQPLVNEDNPQDTVVQETAEQETDLHKSNIRMASAQEGEGPSSPYTPTTGDTNSPKSPASESVGEILTRQGRALTGPRRSQPRPETETEEWQTIQAYIIDFARLLGDAASTKTSTARAYNLYLSSGLSIETFVDKMFQARALTQESSASITKTHTDERGLTRKAKMPYFFAVLEDQLKPEGQRSVRRGGGPTP